MVSKTLILGIGTGRCGTLALCDFLRHQPEMYCTTEAVKIPWYYEDEITEKSDPIFLWIKSDKKIVGDVGSYTLPHVRKIAKLFDDVRLLVVQRDKQATIKSWMKKTHEKHNYWVPHTLGIWKDDLYDPFFPTFKDMERKTKQEAISVYYDFYYDECKKLKSDFKTLWFKTEDSEKIETRKQILEFCGFDKSKWKLNVKCRRNSIP